MEIIKKKFLAAIEKAQNIVITTHSFPDADGIGSQISLCIALKKMGKNAICCNDQKLLSRYKYLDKKDVVTSTAKIDEVYKVKPDLIIVVDTNSIERTGKKFCQYYEKHQPNLLFIDHHPCKDADADNKCIDTSSAATGQLVGELISESLKIEFDQDMALALYTAILIDTSSFRYPTVTAKTHEIIAKLMSTGIKSPQAYNGINGTKKIEHMHLLGHVLATANVSENEEIAWIILTQEILAKYKVDIEDTHGFINNLLILDNVKVACMFRDDGHQLKMSMRSNGSYDVGNIAVKLGGGGHSHSAATLIKKDQADSTSDLIATVIKKIEKELKA